MNGVVGAAVKFTFSLKTSPFNQSNSLVNVFISKCEGDPDVIGIVFKSLQYLHLFEKV